MAELTNQEVGLVDELRTRMGSLLEEGQSQDRFLIRWIRARPGNLDAAEKMLKDSLDWRKEHELGTVLKQEFPAILQNMAPYHILGRDKEGRPVLELPFGKWDIRKLVTTLGEVEFFHFTNQLMERILEQIESCAKKEEDNGNSSSGNVMKFTQATILLNMEGYSYSQLANFKSLQSTMKWAAKYEAHYPEIVGVCLVINAPTIFSMLYSLVKPLLAVNTVNKITVFGRDPTSWGPVLESFVDKDQVGPDFGGTAIRPTPEME